MSLEGPVRRTVVIANPNGLHMRPATVFAQIAQKFEADVTVFNGSKKADGKSSLDLILLTAMPGVELLIEAHGDDASEAIEQLSQILADPGV